jgi:hypothetical protein
MNLKEIDKEKRMCYCHRDLQGLYVCCIPHTGMLRLNEEVRQTFEEENIEFTITFAVMYVFLT